MRPTHARYACVNTRSNYACNKKQTKTIFVIACDCAEAATISADLARLAHSMRVVKGLVWWHSKVAGDGRFREFISSFTQRVIRNNVWKNPRKKRSTPATLQSSSVPSITSRNSRKQRINKLRAPAASPISWCG